MLYIDTSALLRRYVHDSLTPFVDKAMQAEDTWVASAITETETMACLQAAAAKPDQLISLLVALRTDWDAFASVPVDSRCLSAAAEIAAEYRIPIIDAIQLAGCQRLPKPIKYLTLSHRQIPACAGLGYEIVTPLAR